jgi:hypothetical protein
MMRPFPLSALVLEGAEQPKLAFSLEDLFHRPNAEGPDQLLFAVRHAHVEVECLQVAAAEPGAEARHA